MPGANRCRPESIQLAGRRVTQPKSAHQWRCGRFSRFAVTCCWLQLARAAFFCRRPIVRLSAIGRCWSQLAPASHRSATSVTDKPRLANHRRWSSIAEPSLESRLLDANILTTLLSFVRLQMRFKTSRRRPTFCHPMRANGFLFWLVGGHSSATSQVLPATNDNFALALRLLRRFRRCCCCP